MAIKPMVEAQAEARLEATVLVAPGHRQKLQAMTNESNATNVTIPAAPAEEVDRWRARQEGPTRRLRVHAERHR